MPKIKYRLGGFIMTIGAISSYNYSSSYQISFFGTSISASRIAELMDKYNIEQTGDQYADLQALYNAMAAEATQTAVKASTQNSTEKKVETNQAPPWSNIMAQVGLELTGSKETDHYNFNQRISQLLTSATTPQNKATIQQLQAEAAIVFTQQLQESDSSTKTKSNASGADILAQINKMFLMS